MNVVVILASAALAVSAVLFQPVGAVRIGMLEDEVVVSPTREELLESALDLIVTASGNNSMGKLAAVLNF